MRCNRRRHSQYTAVNKGVVAFVTLMILVLTCGAVVNLTLRSRISSLNKDIKKLETESAALKVDIDREQTAWGQISTPSALNNALVRFGIEMRPSAGGNIVKLDGKSRGGNNSGSSAYAAR